MKRVIFFLLTISILSCETPLTEKIEAKYPNDQPKLISYFREKDGKKEKVKEKYFHENGQLKMEGTILNGKREGEWKAYFDNGQIQSIGEFKDGRRTGATKVYYVNGKLFYEGFYNGEKKTGHWKFYNEKGNLVDEKDF